ncbi:MAG: hypothetical protein O9341_21555 [Paucibacter sp.]|nr:hypothetical protein [Roseateles sp.]
MRIQAALPPATPARSAPVPAGEVDAFHGCGWFDSSYELSQGLEVKEGGEDEERLLAELCIATLSLLSTSGASASQPGLALCH